MANDTNNMPYGLKRRAEIIKLTKNAIKPLIGADCDAIVIACNTATTNAISELRAAYPKTHFVGIEPMVKPAAKKSQSGFIAVLATPTTLKSPRYEQLKHRWATHVTVLEPDCSTWAGTIESGHASQIDLNATINGLKRWNVDVIVLGCTHYHWIKDRIRAIAGPGIHILEPSDAIGARLDSLLSINSVLPD